MSDMQKLIQIQIMLKEMGKLLTPDFVERINDRIYGIDWEGDYGNALDYLIDDIDYWVAELNSVQQDMDDFPDDI